MSFRDMKLRRRTAILAAGLAVLLGACSAQPLYMMDPATGGSVQSALSGLEIATVETRVAQEVRNRLLFDLGISRSTTAPRYTMDLVVSDTESPLGVTPVESAPASNVTVTATYTVRDPASGDIVFRDTARASASYDLVNQVFANERAHRDAQNRAAIAVANDIRLQLSAAAARGVI